MARTVDDVALLLAAQAGPDLRSPIALELSGSTFAPPLSEPTRQLRVAWAPDLGGLPIDPVVTDALAHVPEVFEGLGHRVEAACLDLSEAGAVFDTLRGWNFSMSLGALHDKHEDQMKETVKWNVKRGRDMEMAEHMEATQLHNEIYRRVVDFFKEYDALLCPVAQVPPFDVDTEYIREIGGVKMKTYIEWMRVCSDVTLMNSPAISVPAAFTDDGLPVGLQIVGPPRDDLGLLQIAKQFEGATSIGSRRPVLAG